MINLFTFFAKKRMYAVNEKFIIFILLNDLKKSL